MRLPIRHAWGAVLAAAFVAAPAAADEIHLKGGGRVSGRIVERTATRVAIETGPGRVTLPMSRVERIVEGRSAIEAFAERADGLGAGDVVGWAELARWAEERDLLTQARTAWQRVLAVDPAHPEANAGLGRVAVGGVWMSSDDAYRARGYVSFEGRWLTPLEHEAAVREREADEAASYQRREAGLRVQEAEARVREAEARAREAETGADQSEGIPIYGYGYGYGYGIGGPSLGPGHPGRPGRPSHPMTPQRPRPHPGSPNVRPTPAPMPVPQAPPQTRPVRSAPRHQAAVLPPPAPAKR